MVFETPVFEKPKNLHIIILIMPYLALIFNKYDLHISLITLHHNI